MWQQIPLNEVDWARLDTMPDRSVFQRRTWLEFLTDSQGGTPVVAEFRSGNETVATFSGVIVKRFGVKILGSPFPGWTTAYMGFNAPAAEQRLEALRALPDLAFKQLGCMHLEFMDRGIGFDAVPQRYAARTHHTFHTDLTKSEDQLFAEMTGACRRCIRKAEKTGVKVLEVDPAGPGAGAFIDEYYEQMKDVFAKDGVVPPYGKERVRQLVRHLRGTGDVVLLRALDPDGRGIGTSIYVGYNDMAYFWANASFRDGQIWRPNEALHWYGMRYWKARGIKYFDWGGGGEYKVKYGVEVVNIPWMRRSRYPALEQLRSGAAQAMRLRQRVAGAISAHRHQAAAP
jgi:predicted N-acyltransferase